MNREGNMSGADDGAVLTASLVRLSSNAIDIKIVKGGVMSVLQWRRKMFHDRVLIDGREIQREKRHDGASIFGLDFGRDKYGENGIQLLLTVESTWEEMSGMPKRGVRLEAANTLLIASGSLDPSRHVRPRDWSELVKSWFGIALTDDGARPRVEGRLGGPPPAVTDQAGMAPKLAGPDATAAKD
jgi:hypothetical protein